MKTHIVVAAALSALLFCSHPAASIAAPPTSAPAPVVHPVANPLGLTPDQQKKITALNQQAMSQFAALRNNKSLTTQQQMNQAQQMQADMRVKWMAILTPAQRAKVNQMQAKQDAMRAEYMQQRQKLEASLTAAQKSQIQAISNDAKSQYQAIMNNKSLAQGDKMKQLVALQATFRTKVQAIFTPAQRAQVAKINAMH
ncbi:MAG: hypothetical protein ACLQVD_15600 [Capsulimonadaceae bacterium]